MHRMAPKGIDCGEILLSSAILCHIRLLNSVIERTANRCVEEYKLSMSQWMALGCIGYCGEEGITHSELGTRLMLSKAPITGVVDRLARENYVRRVEDDKDRRVSRVVITEHGLETWQSVRHALRTCALEHCECFSEQEQETLLELLSRLLDAVSSSDPGLMETLKTRSKDETNS